jgi:hypothetical protein
VRKIFTGGIGVRTRQREKYFRSKRMRERFDLMMKRRDQKKDRAKNAAGLMNACSKLESDLAAHARI